MAEQLPQHLWTLQPFSALPNALRASDRECGEHAQAGNCTARFYLLQVVFTLKLFCAIRCSMCVCVCGSLSGRLMKVGVGAERLAMMYCYVFMSISHSHVREEWRAFCGHPHLASRRKVQAAEILIIIYICFVAFWKIVLTIVRSASFSVSARTGGLGFGPFLRGSSFRLSYFCLCFSPKSSPEAR